MISRDYFRRRVDSKIWLKIFKFVGNLVIFVFIFVRSSNMNYYIINVVVFWKISFVNVLVKYRNIIINIIDFNIEESFVSFGRFFKVKIVDGYIMFRYFFFV